jgi:hypothetical protein
MPHQDELLIFLKKIIFGPQHVILRVSQIGHN